MKALSIRAPWWWFILHAGKDIENRDWYTSFRGTVYVHASKWYVHRDVINDLGFGRSIVGTATPLVHPYEYLKPFGGCIVGKVDIVDCVRQSSSPWFFGKFGFVLANPVAFARPFACKGMLGLFEVPDCIEQLSTGENDGTRVPSPGRWERYSHRARTVSAPRMVAHDLG